MGLVLAFAAILIVSVTSLEVPDQLDWRENGLITKVKDQGSCDASFYFAALAVLESHYYLSTGEILNLSEQSTIDCSHGYNNGCDGGGLLNTIDFVRSKGVVLEEDYPYSGSVGDCKLNSSVSLFKSIGFEILPKNEDDIKTTVATIGPVGATFKAQDLESYSSGVYKNANCQSGKSYTGVVVGYGTTDEDDDYWIVKMSFGENWGENGYIKLARNTANQCGIADGAIYPIL